MKKVSITIILCLCFIMSQTSTAQELIPIEDVNTIKVYDQLLEEKYPSFLDKKIVTDVYKIDDTYSRIEYNDNGVLTEELVYQRGETKVIIATLVLIDEESVPKPVIDAFDKSPESKYKVNGYYEISPTYGGPIYYAVEYSNEDKKERNYYSKLGRIEERPK